MGSVCAIILNWNDHEGSLACSVSLARAARPPDSIVVVDNGSENGSLPVLRERLAPSVELLQTGANLGYAGGLKVGVDHAVRRGADFLWCMNSDTTVATDALTELAAAASRNGARALYSPVIREMGADHQVYYDGFYLDPLSGEVGPMARSLAHEYGATKSDRIADVIQGASFLVPAAVVAECGFMDASFFLYFEEFDYSLRLRGQGVRSVCALASTVYHRGQGCDRVASLEALRTYYRTRNRIVFWRRHCSRGQILRYTARMLRNELAAELRGEGWCRKAKLRGIVDGIRGRTGKTYGPDAGREHVGGTKKCDHG